MKGCRARHQGVLDNHLGPRKGSLASPLHYYTNAEDSSFTIADELSTET